MEDKKQYRDFFTNPHYRDRIKKSAEHHLNMASDDAHQQIDLNQQTQDDKDAYHSIVDKADLAANAVLSELNGRSGIDLNFDTELNHEIADTVAEIIRQGMDASPYEQLHIVDRSSYLTQHEINQDFRREPFEIYSGEDGVHTPREMRAQLFERFMDKALVHGADQNFTPVERCMQTVRSVIAIIDGEENNNKPDGLGLPLFQLMPSPHPEFTRARMRHELPLYPNDEPLNAGLLGTEYSTGLGRVFEEQYQERFASNIQERTLRSAKELFGKPDDGYDTYR